MGLSRYRKTLPTSVRCASPSASRERCRVDSSCRCSEIAGTKDYACIRAEVAFTQCCDVTYEALSQSSSGGVGNTAHRCFPHTSFASSTLPHIAHLLAAMLLCVICRHYHLGRTIAYAQKMTKGTLRPVFREVEGQMPQGILHIVGFIMRLQSLDHTLASQGVRMVGILSFAPCHAESRAFPSRAA